MSITVLPTRTDDSLGREKQDPETAIALDYQVPAEEHNRAMDLLVDLTTVIGVDTDPAVGSLRYFAERMGYGSPLFYRSLDHFEAKHTATQLDQAWDDTAAGSVIYTPAECGQLLMPLDLGAQQYLCDEDVYLYRSSLPMLEFRVKHEDVSAGGGKITLGLYATSAFNDGWGVYFDPAVSTKWRIFNTVGGATAVKDFATAPSTGTWYTLRVWIYESGGNYYVRGTMDGIDMQSETSFSQTDNLWKRFIVVGSGALAGKSAWLDYYLTEADFSQARV